MPSKMSVTAYVDCSGPMFDGSGEQAVAEMTTDIARQGAQWAETDLRAFRMDKTGRARGDFQASLEVVEKNYGFAVPGPMVTGVTWAPWLEGTSTRNRKSRFKGYKLFAKARQELEDGKAQEIAEEILEKYLPQLGGE